MQHTHGWRKFGSMFVYVIGNMILVASFFFLAFYAFEGMVQEPAGPHLFLVICGVVCFIIGDALRMMAGRCSIWKAGS